jgi:hypothetical protein
MSDDETPARRGPGRPRKQVEPDAPAKRPTSSDERIGQSVDEPTATQIGFCDGRTYRVEAGVIVERVN